MAEIEQLTQPDTQERFWNRFTRQWDDDTKDIEYRIKNQANPLPPNDSESTSVEAKAKQTSKKGFRAANDDEETVRRRDILVSVAVLGELEAYVGEKIEPAKIRTMKKEKLDTLFAAYEAKLGQEIANNGMETVVGTAVKAISWLLPIDDTEKLKEDLMENKPLRRSVGRHCAGVAERYGDLVAFAKVAYDVIKHVKTDNTQGPE